MKLSRWTIIAPIPGRDTALLVQPLSGEAALLQAAQAAALAALPATLPAGLDQASLREMRILVDSDEEDARLLTDAKEAFAVEMGRTPTQLIAVPSFACNLACTYCYQEVFESTRGLVDPAVLDAFFAWIDRFHANDDPPPYITLFGGEPLVDTPAHRDRIQRTLDGARARGLGVAVVSNGYDLEAFAPLLSQGPIREVQVTLDGPQAIHDVRRPHGSGGATFERAVRGIDAMIAAKIPINLRIVVDRANLPALPELARFAEGKGWLDLPQTRFKTQVGRNYELFGCAAGQRRADLFERAELWAAYLELAEREPLLRRFYRPRFHGIGHLAETGELPAPNFDGCPATKKEWAFAPDGTLYGCTATVGNPRYRLGRFYPSIERDDQAIAAWNGRSTFTVAECATCNLAPLCGGGCGALAASRTGTPVKPDCRPVRELLGLGARFYGLDKLDEKPAPMATVPPAREAQRQGCLSCGADLVYLLRAEPMVCAGCGTTHPSRARCERGHFYCDKCHSGSALDAIEPICLCPTKKSWANPLSGTWLKQTVTNTEDNRLSVLVGIPDTEERTRVTSLLRGEGYAVAEAADTHEMGSRLDEAAHTGFDAIVCAGLLSEKDDPDLAARLANPNVARALVLLPSGGLLSTASRAQRLGASAVLPNADRLVRLRELLSQGEAGKNR